MFEEGNILYFNPFYFENGNTPKPKYFLVLKRTEDQVVLASLPTSHDHIPSTLEKRHGCIDDAAINFNCYYFQGQKAVAYNEATQASFAFPRDTYVYGYRIALFNAKALQDQIDSRQTEATYIGKLYDQELTQIRSCLRESTSVKRAFKRIL